MKRYLICQLVVLPSMLLSVVIALGTLPDQVVSSEEAKAAKECACAEILVLSEKVRSVGQQHRKAVVGTLRTHADGREEGNGSGVIISADGWVATVAHALQEPNQRMIFMLADGTRRSGVAYGMHYGLDFGLAKIDRVDNETFPYVEIGDSSHVEIGDWLVAIGHPMGYEIGRPPVVRLGRVEKRRNERGMITTDAPLIGGDSGGPLFDLEGRLVAINQSIDMGSGDLSPDLEMREQSHRLIRSHSTPIDNFIAVFLEMQRGKVFGDLQELGSGQYGDEMLRVFEEEPLYDESQLKAGDEFLSGLQDLSVPFASAVYSVLQDGHQVALATATDSKGLLVSIASELDSASPIVVKGMDENEMAAELVVCDPKSNLALLKVEYFGGTSVEFEKRDEVIFVGTSVVSVGPCREPFGFGILSIGSYYTSNPRNLPKYGLIGEDADGGFVVSAIAEDMPAYRAGLQVGDVVRAIDGISIRSWNHAREQFALKVSGLDVMFEGVRDHVPFKLLIRPLSLRDAKIDGIRRSAIRRASFELIGVEMTDNPKGGRVIGIKEESLAALAGLSIGDIVTSVGGVRVKSSAEVRNCFLHAQPGTRLLIKGVRGEEAQEWLVALPDETTLNKVGEDATYTLRQMIGPVSSRCTGFGAVIVHDGVVLPHQCGGPVVDARGKVIGLNIARRDRTGTFALPAPVVHEALSRLKERLVE